MVHVISRDSQSYDFFLQKADLNNEGNDQTGKPSRSHAQLTRDTF